MNANPFLGVVLHAIGGLAAGSFYVPYRKVKHWAWETYWITGGFFSWVIAPWLVAWLIMPNLLDVLRSTPTSTLQTCYLFGILWGLGGMTFGLTMRFLGIGLGVAIALAFCAVFGTLIPPIYGHKMGMIAATTGGKVILLGIVIALTGIGISGWAGWSKEHEMSDSEKSAAIPEFNLVKGLIVGTLAGILSACWSFGLDAGKPVADAALQHGISDPLKNLPIIPVVALGGFTTNFICCIAMSIKNRTGGNWIGRGTDVGSTAGAVSAIKAPLFSNYIFCALAGVTWYFQFFFYGIGTTFMGAFSFSSWTLHMTFIIVFSTLWGLVLKEWKGSSSRTMTIVAVGLAVLLASTIVVGYGNNIVPPNVK
jgi:L-rhamnose-H+ transport protein